MHLAVYLPLLPPLLAALSARPLAARLDPRLATWLLTGSALILACASSTVLGLLATAGLVRIPVIADLARLSRSALASNDPTSQLVSLTAGAALAAAAIGAGFMIWNRGRALLAAAHQARRLPGTGELVVLDDDHPDAFVLPGLPGRIVVSSRLLGALTGSERAVLIAHERAHLRYHHHWFTSAAQLAATVNPLLRPLSHAIAFTIERWADEHAARACGDRHQVARTVAKAALLKANSPRRPLGNAVLGVTGPTHTELATAGPMPRRVAALLTAPPPRRVLLILAIAAVLLATGLCTAEAVHDLENLLEAAGA